MKRRNLHWLPYVSLPKIQLLAGGFAVVFWSMGVMSVQAGGNRLLDTPSSKASRSPGSGAVPTQTATEATTAAAQVAQTSALAKRAQSVLLKSTQTLQAQQAAQAAAHNAAVNGAGNLIDPSKPIPDGLAKGGLVPGLQFTDTDDPTTVASSVPITANSNGTSSVTIAAGTALTLPSKISGPEQITISGTGTVGTVTKGGTITVLKGGVATTIDPGSTISLPGGGTITFAGGPAGSVPTAVTTYNYGTASNPAATPGSWQGISGISQSVYAPGTGQTTGQTTVSLTQSQQTAILTWQSFNIGKNTILDFDQSAGGSNVGTWVAYNKVASNIAPSQVLGAIQAPGQVYVINQNGIIFGGSSQINVGALVASSLPINDNLVAAGLLNNPDEQFLFTQLNQAAGTQGTPAFTAPAAPTSGLIAHADPVTGELSLVPASGVDGDIVVQRGANLTSPTTPTHVGGKIALIGPNVANNGTIESDDGQVILAAGNQVAFAAHDNRDASLRGLDVFVGSVDSTSGTAVNTGLIEIPRADVTMVGKTINQNGVIDSSTSASLNGRIDLLADYGSVGRVSNSFYSGVQFGGNSGFYSSQSGTVTLGEDSLTQILPELASTETVVGTSLALSSLVNIQGSSIYMAKDALLRAPSANVATGSGANVARDGEGGVLGAGVTLNAGAWTANTNATWDFGNTTGQVYLDKNSEIDVSGSQNVSASVAENIVSAQLLGTELADSPLQQDGALRGATVLIDIRQTGTYNGQEWVGTPLADLSGYVNLIQRTVGELTTAGGTVAIKGGGSVVMQSGSTVDVSGGWINYQGAQVQTTKVVAGGQIYDISQATPDRVYSGIYKGNITQSAKWNITQANPNALVVNSSYEQSYIQGGNGGGLFITAPAMALDGNLLGNTVAGPYQRTTAATLSKTFSGTNYAPTMQAVLGAPVASSLNLTFEAQNALLLPSSPTPPTIIFGNGASGQTAAAAFDPANSALSSDRSNHVFLSTDLVNQDGFSNLTITNNDGNIVVPVNISMATLPSGSITFNAANITIAGSLTAADGTLTFNVSDYSPYNLPTLIANSGPLPPPDATRGNFDLASTGSLSTAGLIVDDRSSSGTAGTLPIATKGGTININSFSANLETGSMIDVSGGAYVSPTSAFTYGDGGTISIQTGQDINLKSLIGGHLTLGSTLQGYSGGKGGTLNLQTLLVQVGGNAGDNGDTQNETLLLNSDFFNQGGFTNFSLNALGAPQLNSQGNPTGQFLSSILIAKNTAIAPVVQTWVGSTTTNGGIVLGSTVLPQGQRAPISLNFNAVGATDQFTGALLTRGQFLMDTGSSITTDPQTTSTGGVSIKGNTVAILGKIIVPGGTITIAGGKSYAVDPSDSTALDEALATVDLGSSSVLSTKGATVLTPNSFGYQTGTVLDGGAIAVSGNIVAESGAVLDVSGTSATLDVLAGSAGRSMINPAAPTAYVSTRVDSNGGTITLTGSQELFTDATLIGAAGGSTAQGGKLSISSGFFTPPSLGIVQTPLDVTLNVTQSGATIPSSYTATGDDVIGTQIRDQNNNVLTAGHFAVNSNLFASTGQALASGGNGAVPTAGGFDSLSLGGTVQFSGPVSITARNTISVGAGTDISGGVILTDPNVSNSSVTLTAAYVKLGKDFQGPLTVQEQQSNIIQVAGNNYFIPLQTGSGSLTVNSSALTDVGNLALENIGKANFNTTLANTAASVAAHKPVVITGNGTITSTSNGTITLANGSTVQLTAGVATTVVAGSSITLANGGTITPSSSGIIPSAVAGDIRGDGSFDIAGNIAMTARQIYAPTEDNFTIAAYDYLSGGNTQSSSVVITAPLGNPTLPPLPLSGGSTLNVYASDITQAGVLRAPLGTINLGWDGTGTSPIDTLSGAGENASQIVGQTVPVIPTTTQLTLTTGSVTSVSAVDPVTHQALIIPYGTIEDGVTWIDPAGNDITAAGNGIGGIPDKSIHIAAKNVDDQSGAKIDISGGGDLQASEFVSGTGGTVDILASKSSYVIMASSYSATPSSANYSPAYAADGFTGSTIAVGQEVYLGASNGLKAGYYTLLPAQYALLPGAYLVTPKSSITPTGTTQVQPDGSRLVTGFVTNGLSSATGQRLMTTFEVAPQSVVKSRAQYDISSANTFLAASAQANNQATPRLPTDAGQVILSASQTMTLQGDLNSAAATGGLGGQVDISSPNNIFIYGPNSAPVAGALNLDSSQLTAFGADSLLIGGFRTSTTTGTQVTVTTDNVTVDNAGSTTTINGQVVHGLAGPDVILVSNGTLTLAANADVEQGPRTLSSPAQTLTFGQVDASGNVVTSGDGALLRVTSDPTAQIVRVGVDSQSAQAAASNHASEQIGQGATITGANVTLDSTFATSLDSTAVLKGTSVSLNSGQISLVLNTTGTPSPAGLVLSDAALQNLQSTVQNLSLSSYSSIDIYGSGQIGNGPDASGKYPVASLALHAAGIRGDGGDVIIDAQNIALDNSTGGTVSGLAPIATPGGSLTFNASTVQLGASGQTSSNSLGIQGYDDLNINASSAVVLQSAGSVKQSDGTVVKGAFGLTTAGNLTLTTPLITGATGANQSITAGGALAIQAPTAGTTTKATSDGLGASLNLIGKTVTDSSAIILHSGSVTAEAQTGDVTVASGGSVDVSGVAKPYNDVIEYTSGGDISLMSDNGSVNVATGATVNVSANSGGGDAGTLAIRASKGTFTHGGSLLGKGGAGGQSGTFTLDAGTIAGGNIQTINDALGTNSNNFTQSITIRDRTDANVVLNGSVRTASYSLAADQGAITVNGTVDASNVASEDSTGKATKIGGTIDLEGANGVTLASGAKLDASAANFSNAGKGGAITLGTTNGRISLAANSTINLQVANAGQTAANTAQGDFTGTLHLRAPQVLSGGVPVDVAVDPLAGTILGASYVNVEGFHAQDAATAGTVSIDGTLENNALANAAALMANAAAIQTRLTTGTTLTNVYVTPGEEIDNSKGSLVLNNNWDLSTARYGPANAAPGSLTIRAAGNLIFNGTLSDGFTSSAYTANVLTQKTAMPTNLQSWSYQLTTGTDFSAVDTGTVKSADALTQAGLGGSLEIGKIVTANNGDVISTLGNKATTTTLINGFYQVIRTGTGDISINAGQNVELLNQFATIYTAGVQVTDPTLGGTFITPVLSPGTSTSNSVLGVAQETTLYAPQYTLGGGNITIEAQGDIEHLKQENGSLVADSEKELPNNWLNRRGFVNAATGQFGLSQNPNASTEIESTTWWIDFSNFFEGIGALGGGNVTLVAGNDINNVDAVIPTNARMPAGTPDASKLVELGGGDLTVKAGNNLNAGVYYVERGQGSLSAGNSIITNETRSTSTAVLGVSPVVNSAETWLPTTLFLGKGSFDVTAGNDLTLGPVANPFLLPEGYNNTFWDKTYFSTYAPSDQVNVSALTGAVTLRESATLAGSSDATPMLLNWLNNVSLLDPQSIAFYQPWLRLNESSADPFGTADPIFNGVVALMPASLNVTAFGGDINTVGNLTLSPSATGTVNLIANGSINGLQINGVVQDNSSGLPISFWGSTTINLSDADPNALPGITSPFAFQPLATPTNAFKTKANFLSFFTDFFEETGATQGLSLQDKQKLHASIGNAPLHANDTNPVHLFAQNGNISSVTLFAGKSAQIVAGQDITDIAFYVQNNTVGDVSLVNAGRDLIAYDANAPLLVSAEASGNSLNGLNSAPLAGDIQIGGPGTLEVLAGRNLNLGNGPSNTDGANGSSNGTQTGITSIGNERNPSLSQSLSGADVFAGAGIGAGNGLAANANLNFTSSNHTGFTDLFLNPDTGGAQALRYLPDLATLMGLPSSDTPQDIWNAFLSQKTPEQQNALALDVFYLVLRDSGRDHNDPSSPNAGGYAAGTAAIDALFPNSAGLPGDITLTSREIKTQRGGDINLFAPGGQLNVGLNISGAQPVDQGILTEDGGNINIFTDGDVNVGTSRIFTLHGGNEIIWSSNGNIAAGSSSKTVQSAPPTRVLIDPQSADVQTDLAGLSTGGGIGVLETVPGAPPADIDLIAPKGFVIAGDAGIRASGNLNIAAVAVLNAGNISVGGKSAGTPVASSSNVAGLTAASNTAGASNNTASDAARQAQARAQASQQTQYSPSIITVEVIGYGGGDDNGA